MRNFMCCEVKLEAAGEIMKYEQIRKGNGTNEIRLTLNCSIFIKNMSRTKG